MALIKEGNYDSQEVLNLIRELRIEDSEVRRIGLNIYNNKIREYFTQKE